MATYQNFNTSSAAKSDKLQILHEHDVVTVIDDTHTKEKGILKGFLGTVVHIYKDKDRTCEVEFPMVPVGKTQVLTVPAKDLKRTYDAKPND